MQNKQIIINGYLVNYYFDTRNEKTPSPTLVFLHGWGSNSMLWFQNLQLLINKGYNIYCLDLPGFGKSQMLENPYTLSDYCNIVKDFVAKNELSQITLIGHSFGGRITIKLASENPNFINSIVLVDAGGIKVIDKNLKLKKLLSRIVKPIFQPNLMQGLRKRIYSILGAEDYINASTPALQKTFVNIVDEDLLEFLPKINKKTLIVWGENDNNAYTTINHAKIMHEKIVNSELEIIPNAKHYSFLDQPEKFSQILINFVDKLKL